MPSNLVILFATMILTFTTEHQATTSFVQELVSNHSVVKREPDEDPNIDPNGCFTQMKIVGGNRCHQSQMPSIVQILVWEQGEMLTKCGGTLIKADLVLTAAHCLGKDQMWIRQATDNYPEHDDHYDNERTKVINQWIHPAFNYTWYTGILPSQSKSKLLHVRHDVGILQIKVTPNVVHWRHALSRLPTKPFGEEICTYCNLVQILGWGLIKEELGSGTLRCVIVPVTPMETCMKNYVLDYTDKERVDYMCTSTTGKMAFRGDSGGPVVCKNTQVGIVSWGRYSRGLALYTRVDRELDFIKKIIRKTEFKRNLLKFRWIIYEKKAKKKFYNDITELVDLIKAHFTAHVKPLIQVRTVQGK